MNDEPVLEDALGHFQYARQVGEEILLCDPPYVVGIQGSWGAGKTSFLRKLWAYLGGDTNRDTKQLQQWFGADWKKLKHVHPIWFNPWHHQFEANPTVALLQEIRQHFAMSDKVIQEIRKAGSVSLQAGLSILGDLIVKIANTVEVKAKTDLKANLEKYNTDHFLSPLASQRFRELFQGAISQLTASSAGSQHRLVIFIDDLDRCEGEAVFRLLEGLKLFLNAENCVYVLGLDQKHLEETIARVLSKKDDTWTQRPLAREYLGKMFQHQFLLPRNPTMTGFLKQLVPLQGEFATLMGKHYKVGPAEWNEVIQILDDNLPHNPRKMKSFLGAWRLHLRLLTEQHPTLDLNWRIVTILTYLGQFEEPLFRRVEELPAFFNEEIVPFAKTGGPRRNSAICFKDWKCRSWERRYSPQRRMGSHLRPSPATRHRRRGRQIRRRFRYRGCSGLGG